MSNRFFTNILNLVARTKARAGAVEADFDGVGAGFDAAQVELDAAIRAPNGEVLDRLPAAAARASKSLVFDSSGGVAVAVAATSVEMDAAIAAAVSATTSADEAAASAAALSGSANAIHRLQLLSGII